MPGDATFLLGKAPAAPARRLQFPERTRDTDQAPLEWEAHIRWAARRTTCLTGRHSRSGERAEVRRILASKKTPAPMLCSIPQEPAAEPVVVRSWLGKRLEEREARLARSRRARSTGDCTPGTAP